jgi:hypothetical protein
MRRSPSVATKCGCDIGGFWPRMRLVTCGDLGEAWPRTQRERMGLETSETRAASNLLCLCPR